MWPRDGGAVPAAADSTDGPGLGVTLKEARMPGEPWCESRQSEPVVY